MSEVILHVKDLTASYGESQVLRGASLSIQKGETVALLGRNGAGKTTTLNAIMGVIRDRSGHITFRGQDVMRLPLHKVARLGLGYVPDDRGIFASLTVEENLMLPPTIAEGGYSVDKLFSMFPNLAERRLSMGTMLSGGEQQMLAIARVLRTGVSMLLLDEPTEGLAPVIVQRIGSVLKELRNAGMTVLLVEQNFRFARGIADRFYLMENGRVVDGFSKDEVPEKMEALHKLLGV